MGYLEIAAAEVGYHGNPENVTKYWADLAPNLQGLPWCGCFVSWCLKEAGSLGSIGGAPIYSVPVMVQKARAAGQWTSSPQGLAIFDFGTGVPAHVEFVVSASGSSLVSIGGNTTGDVVSEKTRDMSQVLGFWAIEAAAGSVPEGPVSIGNFTLSPVPAQAIDGESGDVDARFSGRKARIMG